MIELGLGSDLQTNPAEPLHPPVNFQQAVIPHLGSRILGSLDDGYQTQSGSQLSQVVLAGAGGQRRLLGELRNYAHPRLSPDGRTLAFAMSSADRRDVWRRTSSCVAPGSSARWLDQPSHPEHAGQESDAARREAALARPHGAVKPPTRRRTLP